MAGLHMAQMVSAPTASPQSTASDRPNKADSDVDTKVEGFPQTAKHWGGKQESVQAHRNTEPFLSEPLHQHDASNAWA